MGITCKYIIKFQTYQQTNEIQSHQSAITIQELHSQQQYDTNHNHLSKYYNQIYQYIENSLKSDNVDKHLLIRM